MWNPNTGQPGPNPYPPPNIGYPGGSNPALPPPVNPRFLRPFPAPQKAPQRNAVFPHHGPPHPLPQLGYPGCQPPGPYPPPYPPLAAGMPPVNPLAPGMLGPGVTMDKKMQKKMKKAHKMMHKHHKHGKHSSSPDQAALPVEAFPWPSSARFLFLLNSSGARHLLYAVSHEQACTSSPAAGLRSLGWASSRAGDPHICELEAVTPPLLRKSVGSTVSTTDPECAYRCPLILPDAAHMVPGEPALTLL
ncbi:proline-rich protein 13-like [Lemur catta]|uniref:proline-rich protein 13-like n=1 Tax=Lemur catta TaxID=9447 RepID=UPI001E26D71B|nr:proline-rich protein 13-like [Lemur catta]